MKVFHYVALGPDGRRFRGKGYAVDASELRNRLIEGRLHPLAIRRALFTGASLRLSAREAARLAQDLAQLLDSGLALAPALALLESREGPKLAAVTRDIRRRLVGGEPLSRALESAKGGPVRLLQALARAGEASGQQAGTLAAGARSLAAVDQLRRRLITLSLYPGFVIAVALGSIAVYAFAVLPSLQPAFEGMGDAVPAQTQAVLAFGAIMRVLLPALAIGSLGAALILAALPRVRREGGDLLARAMMALPVSPLRDFVFAGLASRLAVMLEAGVPLAAAWRLAREPISIPSLGVTLAAQDERLLEGARLSEVLARVASAPKDLVHYVALGERSGRSPKALNDASALLATRAQEAIERLLSVFTPVVIILVGGMVGVITMMVFQGLLAVSDAVAS